MPYKYSESSRINQCITVQHSTLPVYRTFSFCPFFFFFFFFFHFFFFVLFSFFVQTGENTLRTPEDLRTIWNSSSLTRTTILLNSPLVFFSSLPSTLTYWLERWGSRTSLGWLTGWLYLAVLLFFFLRLQAFDWWYWSDCTLSGI